MKSFALSLERETNLLSRLCERDTWKELESNCERMENYLCTSDAGNREFRVTTRRVIGLTVDHFGSAICNPSILNSDWWLKQSKIVDVQCTFYKLLSRSRDGKKLGTLLETYHGALTNAVMAHAKSDFENRDIHFANAAYEARRLGLHLDAEFYL